MKYPIKVSILVITYNHESYLREALDSILMQQHNFTYEIIISDDCSTDGTMRIVQEYAGNHKEIIVLPNERNVGITKNYERAFKACSGEYVAVLEGDDYWTSPYKIQKMVDFLDENLGCSMAFNRFIVSETKTKKFNVQPWPIREKFQLITISDLIQDNMIGNFSTCVYRNDVLRKIDSSLFNLKVYDWMFNMVNAQFGLIGYIPDVMSVYRLHSQGTWTQKTEKEKINDMLESIDTYNAYFNLIYDSEFQQHRSRLVSRLETSELPQTRKQKTKNFVKSVMPPLLFSLVKQLIPPAISQKFRNM